MSSVDLLRQCRDQGRRLLDEPRTKAVLAEFGIAVPNGGRIDRPEDAAGMAASLRGPFAVKLVSPDAVHKSDLGVVRIGLADAAAVAEAVAALAAIAQEKALRVDGYLIEEMATPGTELAIGGMIDARFGPVIMAGLGGIFVEIFQDVAFRLCPIDAHDAGDMLDELKGAPLLAGARGQRPVDRGVLIECLLRIGGAGGLLMSLAPHIRELDINPLIASATAAVAVDGRIVLADAGAAHD